MMKIVSFKICPFVQRVTALLAAKDVPYEIEYISLKDKPQWFIDASPNGQVPILITDSGITLFESDAIVEYLDEVSQPIEEGLTPEQRAIDRAWSYMAAKNYLSQCSAMRSADRETLAKRTAALQKIFAKVEAVLGKGPYFKGDQISNVDIAWLPLLHRAHLIKVHAEHDLLVGFPKVQAWQQAIMHTSIVTQSVSDDFESKFTDFYLSPSTYLGTAGGRLNTDNEKCQSASCC